MKAEFLLDAGAQLGEGPIWDDRAQRLLWIDIEGKALHIYYPETGRNCAVAVGQKIGAAFLTESGSVAAALQDGIYIIDVEGGKKPSLFAKSPEAHLPGNRFNDGKCDSKGRIWVGTMNMEAQPEQAAMYRIDPDGTCTRMLEGVSISNGLCWSRDDKFMYYIDTPSGFLWRFDFDSENGTIENRTPVIDYRAEAGDFDGMTMDSEGMLWIGHWGGFQVSRWDPSTGEKIGRIDIPVPNASCCEFGGENLNRLYITTATGRDKTIKKNYPLSGSLFGYDAGIRGLPCKRFGI